MAIRGYLGIDAGTQGLSVLLTDERMQVIAIGHGGYKMVAGLDRECFEQLPADWTTALKTAMQDLRARLSCEWGTMQVLSIGISGQMHGEVLADSDGHIIGPARLWCDGRNQAEADELTSLFGVKIPKRATAARFLWTTRHRPSWARRTKRMTTPAGWISHYLTGGWCLGIGDAAGMFPIDQVNLNYDTRRLGQYDQLVSDIQVSPLADLLPTIRRAGEAGGVLCARGGELLGLPAGIPLAPAEGDQPAALAGSLIGQAGMVSVSFGTSVCANSVGDRPFRGVSVAVDHFCAPDGKPINMVFLQNGTTFMNRVVALFEHPLEDANGGGFAAIMPQLLAADPDCGGLLALPFMDGEPGLEVGQGGTALIVGWNSSNAKPGNVVKAALLATMFNLRLGSEVLDRQGYPRTELILSGGLTKTPELGQILADVFATPVTLLDSAEEGTAWGAALLAKYRHFVIGGSTESWSSFLSGNDGGQRQRFTPNPAAVAEYQATYERYQRLVRLHPAIVAALHEPARSLSDADAGENEQHLG